jgi:transcriptional regulator with XRE-family HTH domain
MRLGELERQQFMKEIKDHIEAIISSGVPRQALASELRVTKQAISSYLKGRTMPKPHVLRRLLAKWPHTFRYRGKEFGPAAFGVEPERISAIAIQEHLFESLSQVRKENMRVEVERGSGSETELRLIIKVRAFGP